MLKLEAQQQIILNQYLREKKMYGFFELKVTMLDYFSFSKIEQVQYDGLIATEQNGLVWKLSDLDTRPKPCDSLSIPPMPSYLVIKFKDGFYFIRFRDIVRLKENGDIAITLRKAEELAEKVLITKVLTPTDD